MEPEYEFDESMFAILYELRDGYVLYRRKGLSREEAVEELLEDYAGELEDGDTAVFVWLGLAFALCKKKELTAQLRDRAMDALEAEEAEELRNCHSPQLKKLVQRINDPEMLGPEARYPKMRKPYVPDWQVGDVFVHELQHPRAKALGIAGLFFLLWKMGDYEDAWGKIRHMFYMTLCPPDKLPQNAEELYALGFLKNYSSPGPNFLVEIKPKSRKDEAAYELTRIGNIPDAKAPPTQVEVRPYCADPLFNLKLEQDYGCVDYETYACQQYKRYGIFRFT